jgi:hypothetical protein
MVSLGTQSLINFKKTCLVYILKKCVHLKIIFSGSRSKTKSHVTMRSIFSPPTAAFLPLKVKKRSKKARKKTYVQYST